MGGFPVLNDLCTGCPAEREHFAYPLTWSFSVAPSESAVSTAFGVTGVSLLVVFSKSMHRSNDS